MIDANCDNRRIVKPAALRGGELTHISMIYERSFGPESTGYGPQLDLGRGRLVGKVPQLLIPTLPVLLIALSNTGTLRYEDETNPPLIFLPRPERGLSGLTLRQARPVGRQ